MFFLQKQHRNYKKDLARIDEIIEFCTKANEKLTRNSRHFYYHLDSIEHSNCCEC
jgi:hypothetical protein